MWMWVWAWHAWAVGAGHALARQRHRSGHGGLAGDRGVAAAAVLQPLPCCREGGVWGRGRVRGGSAAACTTQPRPCANCPQPVASTRAASSAAACSPHLVHPATCPQPPSPCTSPPRGPQVRKLRPGDPEVPVMLARLHHQAGAPLRVGVYYGVLGASGTCAVPVMPHHRAGWAHAAPSAQAPGAQVS